MKLASEKTYRAKSNPFTRKKNRNYFQKFPTPQNSPILQHTHADTKFLIKRRKMRPLNEHVTQLSNRADISSASMLKICLAQYFQQCRPPGDKTWVLWTKFFTGKRSSTPLQQFCYRKSNTEAKRSFTLLAIQHKHTTKKSWNKKLGEPKLSYVPTKQQGAQLNLVFVFETF